MGLSLCEAVRKYSVLKGERGQVYGTNFHVFSDMKFVFMCVVCFIAVATCIIVNYFGWEKLPLHV